MKSWTHVVVGLLMACGLLGGLSWLLSRDRPAEPNTENAGQESNAVQLRASARSSTAQHSRPRPDRNGAQSRFGTDGNDDQETNKLSRRFIEQYLSSRGRTADNLLAAFSASQDKSYLKEAAKNFPDNPQIQLAMALYPASPEEQRVWIERLKQTDQNNAVGYYLSALDQFRQKNPQAAIQELATASDLGIFNNYRQQQGMQVENLHLAAGNSSAAAKTAALEGITAPKLLSYVKELSDQLSEFQAQYTQANDTPSVLALANAGVRLGRRLNYEGGGSMVMDQLIGISVEQQFLAQLDTTASPDFVEKPVSQRLAELQKQKETLQQQTAELNQMFQSQPDENVQLNYLNRVQTTGEAAAQRWILSNGQNP